jgi:hypothetical protein
MVIPLSQMNPCQEEVGQLLYEFDWCGDPILLYKIVQKVLTPVATRLQNNTNMTDNLHNISMGRIRSSALFYCAMLQNDRILAPSWPGSQLPVSEN